MKKVIVASENPVKISVAKRAFSSVYPDDTFEFLPVQSASGVPDQPMNKETEQGALNRLDFIKRLHPEADYWISQEGGLYADGENLYNRAWIAVCDHGGHVSKSSTALFYLPPAIATYIREGLELGHAVDKYFGSVNSKQGMGAIGHLTDGLIDREHYYLQAAIIALSELKHKDWYRE
jgi:inosine/xanthosine triphosphatase